MSSISVTTLRELFRNVEAFRDLYTSFGVDVIQGPDGTSWSLWDIEYLVEQIDDLPPRMRQAIQLGLIEHLREAEVATIMGIGDGTPAMAYATRGIKKLIERIERGELPRFRAMA